MHVKVDFGAGMAVGKAHLLDDIIGRSGCTLFSELRCQHVLHLRKGCTSCHQKDAIVHATVHHVCALPWGVKPHVFQIVHVCTEHIKTPYFAPPMSIERHPLRPVLCVTVLYHVLRRDLAQ